MELNDYQDKAMQTGFYPGRHRLEGLIYTALGAAGEAGEVANKVKKIIRDNDGSCTGETKDAIASEVGDVLWYLAMLASEVGYTLEEIARMNIQKLASRAERSALTGSGDNR